MVEALNAWERWEMPPAIVLDLFLLALDHPERVERLMALDNAPPWRDAIHPRVGALALPVLGSYQAVLATPFLGRRVLTTSGHFVRAMIRGASGPRKRWSDRELDAYSEVLKQSSRARASTSCYRTFLTRELAGAALAATGPATCEYQHYSRWDRRAPCGGPLCPASAKGCAW